MLRKDLNRSSFEWVANLRYYYEKNNLVIKMFSFKKEYSWEYLGN